jgi:hypothetical protein
MAAKEYAEVWKTSVIEAAKEFACRHPHTLPDKCCQARDALGVAPEGWDQRAGKFQF